MQAKFEPTYIKNFFPIEKTYDFNWLSNLLNRNNFAANISSNYMNQFILESIIMIQCVEKDFEFQPIFSNLENKFNIFNQKSNLHIFFSMVSGIKSMAHTDICHALTICLYGKILYKIGDEEYLLNPSDLLIVPQGMTHMAIGITPRIVLSYGIYV